MAHRLFLPLCCLVAMAGTPRLTALDAAPVFQYATEIAPGKWAYLWLPAGSTALDGLLVASMTSAEFSLVRDAEIRDCCARNDLGIVFFYPSFNGSFSDGASTLPSDPASDPRQLFDAALTALATASGHPEVAHAPYLTFGHSTSALFARNVAYWRPERCIGGIYFKAGDILRKPKWSATYGDATVADRLAGQVWLQINGQFEEFGPSTAPIDGSNSWESGWREGTGDILALRAAGNPAAQLIDPGAGHHGLSPDLIAPIVAWIDGVIPRRVPGPATAGPVTLTAITLSDGWLGDSAVDAPAHASASWGGYAGDRDQAFWWPDQSAAQAADALHAALPGGTHQFIDLIDGNGTVDVYVKNPGIDYARQAGTFQPIADGIGRSCSISARYRSTVPDKWPGGGAASSSGAAIGFTAHPFGAFELVGTPVHDAVTGISTGTFTVRSDGWGHDWPGLSNECFLILAEGPASGGYRRCVRGLYVDKWSNTAGTAQSITVPTLADRTAAAAAETLSGSASSGLPVLHVVRYGPAQVVHLPGGGQQLVISQVPAGAAYPITVEVLSSQWGRPVSPQVAAAPTVVRTFQITGPGAGNTDPVAAFSRTPAVGPAPLLVGVDATASSDGDGDPLGFAWDFGDGASGSGVTASHTYTTHGVRTITLTVDDGQGGSDTATATVTVQAQPQITAGPSAAPAPVTATTTSLSATASDADSDDATLVYTWSVTAKPSGAATPGIAPNGNAAAANATATFSMAGNYSLLLTVSDGDGLTVTAPLSVVVAQTASGLMVTP